MVDILDVAKVVGAAIILLGVITVVAGEVVDVTNEQAGSVNVSEDALFDANDEATLSRSGRISNVTAVQSLNTTYRFTGAADSYLAGSADVDGPLDDTWSVSTWARLNGSVDQANATQRVLRFGGWLYIDYNQTQWRAIYYDESTFNTYVLEGSDATPTTYTNLIVVHESGSPDTLTLYRNNTAIDSTTLTDANAVDANFSAANLHGRVEETRVYDDTLTNTQRSQLNSQPTAPLRANETARIYYDARTDGAAVDIYRTGGDLRPSNATLVTGFIGQGAQEGTDWSRSGNTVTALNGGTLDGAPVVFVTYTWADYLGPFAGVLDALTNAGVAALTLLVVGLVVIAARAVTDALGGGF